jgi:hypothetical protein
VAGGMTVRLNDVRTPLAYRDKPAAGGTPT